MFKSSDRYGDRLNSYDVLKLVALLTMIIDHVGYYLLQDVQWLRAVGRMAFPLFLFLVGYSGVWKIKHDIVIWAVLIAVCGMLTYQPLFPLSILVTILFVRLAMSLLVKHFTMTPLFLAILYVACVALFPYFYWCDYSSIALLFAMSGYLQRQQPRSTLSLTFLYAAMAVHFTIETTTFSFLFPAWLCMAVTLAWALNLMHCFTIRSVTGGPHRVLQWASRNTLPIYGGHVMLLMIAQHLYIA